MACIASALGAKSQIALLTPTSLSTLCQRDVASPEKLRGLMIELVAKRRHDRAISASGVEGGVHGDHEQVTVSGESRESQTLVPRCRAHLQLARHGPGHAGATAHSRGLGIQVY